MRYQTPQLIKKRIIDVQSIVFTVEPGEDLDEITFQLACACISQELNKEEKETFREEIRTKQQIVKEYWKGEPVYLSLKIRDDRIVFSLRQLLRRWRDLDPKSIVPASAINHINGILKKAESKIAADCEAPRSDVKATVAKLNLESYQKGIVSNPPFSFFEIILALNLSKQFILILSNEFILNLTKCGLEKGNSSLKIKEKRETLCE